MTLRYDLNSLTDQFLVRISISLTIGEHDGLLDFCSFAAVDQDMVPYVCVIRFGGINFHYNFHCNRYHHCRVHEP